MFINLYWFDMGNKSFLVFWLYKRKKNWLLRNWYR